MALDPSSLASGALDTLTRLFGELPRVARRMAVEQASQARVSRVPTRAWWLVPGLKGRFRYRLQNGERAQANQETPVYDIEVGVRAGLVEPGTDAPDPIPVRSRIPFRVRVPNLIRVGREDQVLLDLRSSGLGLIRFENVSRQDVRVFVDNTPVTGAWPVEPVLAFAREVRKWVADPLGHSRELIGVLPRVEDPDELRQVLAVILDGFVGINNALAPNQSSTRPDPNPFSLPWDEPLLEPVFEVEEYRATVDLRLNPDGKLVTKDRSRLGPDDRHRTVQVQMELEMLREQERWVARAACRPPDFLVDGEVAQAVRAAFADRDGFLKDLSKALGRADVGKEDLQRFLLEAPEASVMRVGRDGDEDTELLIVEGTLGGQSTAVLAVAEVEFKKGDRTVVEDLDDVRLLYPDAKAQPGLDAKDQDWLLQVIRAARLWGGFGFLDARGEEGLRLS